MRQQKDYGGVGDYDHNAKTDRFYNRPLMRLIAIPLTLHVGIITKKALLGLGMNAWVGVGAYRRPLLKSSNACLNPSEINRFLMNALPELDLR